ncbi:hypothetical protein [Prevotella fusca]|nr:hypothetical protein [Prevotella fusca]
MRILHCEFILQETYRCLPVTRFYSLPGLRLILDEPPDGGAPVS